MSGDGEAYPWCRWFNLADLDSTPPEDVLSLGLTELTIIPSIAPDESSWTAGGLSAVAPISAAARVARGLRPSSSGQGGGGISVLRSYRLCLLGSLSVVRDGRVARWGGGLRPVESRRLEEACGRIGTPWVSRPRYILFACTAR